MKKRIPSLILALVVACALVPQISLKANAHSVVMTADEFIGYLLYVVSREDSRYGSGGQLSVGKYDGNYIYFDCWGLGESIICTKGKIVYNRDTSLNPWNIWDTSCGCGSYSGDWIKTQCQLSNDFTNMVPGEWLFRDNSSGNCYHVGYYIGNGKVIESTSDGSYNTQISTIDSSGHSNLRGSSWTWTSHGKVPWIEYCNHKDSNGKSCYSNVGICSKCNTEYDWQSTYNTDCAGLYEVNKSGGLYLRLDKPYDASTNKSDLIKKGTRVQVLGSVTNHYEKNGVYHKWYKISYNGVTGYAYHEHLTLVPHTCDKGTYMYYEEIHPHRSCYKCSVCGKIWAEEGSTNKMPSCQQCAASVEHTCDKGTYMYKEAVHPHRSCYKCSVCGKIWAVPGTSNFHEPCLTCQQPGKPVLTNLEGKYFSPGAAVTFTWAATNNTTHYNLYIQHKNSSGQWEKYDQLFYVSSGMTLMLPANEYRCYIQSYNSNYWAADGSDWLYTEGDFTYFSVVKAGCSHSYSSSVTTAATCVKNGVRTYTCSKCGASYTETIPATGNHSYTSKVTTAATCGSKGTKTYTCSGCSASYTESIPATGNHSYTGKVTTAATCGSKGTKTYTCSGCAASYTETIPATGNHSYGEWYRHTTEEGKTYRRCDCINCSDFKVIYTVYFEGYGSNYPESMKFETKTLTSLPSQIPEYFGWNFTGWNYGGNSYKPDGPIAIDEDIVLTSMWDVGFFCVDNFATFSEDIQYAGTGKYLHLWLEESGYYQFNGLKADNLAMRISLYDSNEKLISSKTIGDVNNSSGMKRYLKAGEEYIVYVEPVSSNFTGTLQWAIEQIHPGDMDGDGTLTTDDAVYLLLSVMFGAEDYPVPAGTNLDFDGNRTVDTDDAVYLLLNVMFGDEDYPLNLSLVFAEAVGPIPGAGLILG